MPDRRVTDDMVTRALEVLQGAPPDADLVRRALEDALLAPGAAAVVTEYAEPMNEGYHLWDTTPADGKPYPLEAKIEAVSRSSTVSRRSIIVVDDWAEVTGP